LKAIATDKLCIANIKSHFKDKPVFETPDIIMRTEEEKKKILVNL
jgi:hypothetical protein